LDDNACERDSRLARMIAFFTFQFIVDFESTFCEQEQSATQQDDIPLGDIHPKNGEERIRQADDPAQREQQQDAGDHGHSKAQLAGAWLSCLWQFARQDGNENDVINAQDDFKDGQGEQGNAVFHAKEFHNLPPP
jgi:hypothetical protein